MALVSFSSGQVIKSADVNANFALAVLTDTARSVTVTHTWSASQTFTGGWTAGAACTVSTGGLTVTAGGLTVTTGGLTVSASGITVTGNSTITGTLGGVTTLTCTTVTATNLGGALSTAAQPNVTSVGTLTSLTLSGNLATNQSTFNILGGATATSLRNAANNADNLLVSNAGAVTVRAGMTVSASGITVTGNSTITGTLGGLTGLTVASGGATITAGGLTVSASGITVTGNSTIAGTLTSLTGITSSGTAALGTVTASATVTAATGVTSTVGPMNIGSGSGYQYGGTTVVTSRKTGWSSQSITPGSRGDMGLTPTTQAVANTLAALITDLTSHGLIGA